MAHPVINRSNESKRDALIAYALAHLPDDEIDDSVDPPATLATRIRTPEDLYEYFLLDTRIGGDVETARIAEAIGSVQLYIDRCLQQLEPGVADTPDGTLAEAMRPGGFLDEWDRYNKRYATWAGREQALFYPEPYLDPLQRNNTTPQFDNLAQTLGQGRITLERVEAAYKTYLAEYDELTDLDTISAYQAGDALGALSEDIYYLIGRNRNTRDQFYWRCLDMRRARGSDAARQPLAGAWSPWQKLDAGLGTPLGQFAAPFMMNGQFHIAWLTQALEQSGQPLVDPDDPLATTPAVGTATFVETARLRHDGVWQHARKFALDVTGQTLAFDKGFSVVVDDRKKWLALFFAGNGTPGTPGTPVQIDYYGAGAAFKAIDHAEKSAWGNVGRPGENRPTLLFTDQNAPGSDAGLVGRTLRLTATDVTVSDALPVTACVIEQGTTGWCTVKLSYLAGDACPYFTFKLVTYPPANAEAAAPAPTPTDTAHRRTVADPRAVKADPEPTVLWEVSGEVESSESQVDFFFDVDATDGTVMTLTYSGTTMPDGTPVLSGTTHFVATAVNYVGADLTANVLRLGPPRGVGELQGADTMWQDGAPIRLSTHFAAIELKSRIRELAGSSVMYGLQTLAVEPTVQDANTLEPIDFDGAYGIYFWEMFFHAPFAIAARLRQEQRFDEAGQWYKHLFNAGGYRRPDGTLDLTGDPPAVRYWNVRPLQEDTAWDADLDAVAAPDPYAVALADPMHYKMAVFMHTLDWLIERADASYRRLDRDSLGEAKLLYVQAGQLLGPRPALRYSNDWEDRTLGAMGAIGAKGAKGAIGATGATGATGAIRASSALDSPPPSPSSRRQPAETCVDGAEEASPAAALLKHIRMADGPFLPPYNDALLAYWDKLDVRLYNLRHNLTLDGQPLSLPLYGQPFYAVPGSAAASGDDAAGGLAPGSAPPSDYRYAALAQRASLAVDTLSQFGERFLGVLKSRDESDLVLLAQTHQRDIQTLVRGVQADNLQALQQSLIRLNAAKDSAIRRRDYYAARAVQRWSDTTKTACDLRISANTFYSVATGWYSVGAGLDLAPNVFGFTTGGMNWGAVSEATGKGIELTANALEASAASYETQAAVESQVWAWEEQRDAARDQSDQLSAEIDERNTQLAMATKQRDLADREAAHAQAVFDMQDKAFTGPPLWRWAVGRLSALYYQLYDAVMPLCLATRAAFEAEFGPGSAGPAFTRPAWNDLYQGLSAGEALALDLQQLENRYLQLDKRALEIEKTVSANALVVQGDPEKSFKLLCSAALSGGTAATADGALVITAQNGALDITLDLAKTGTAGDYSDVQGTRRIKSIGVTLLPEPVPLQTVEAILSLTGNARANNVRAAISRGRDDAGLFDVDLGDSKYLPFEGCDPSTGTLTLAIYKAGTTSQPGAQYPLVSRLDDVTVRLRYTVL